MSQIIGGHTFVPLEKNIDDVKLNAITGGAVITSELISTQTLSTSAVTGDQFLILKAGGTLARILYDDLATSILSNSQLPPIVTAVRLRSFNALGSFEVDQRNVGTSLVIPAGSAFAIDRWAATKSSSAMTATAQQISGLVSVPGTNFAITQKFLRITLTASQATLAAGDYLNILQSIEGPQLRELISDVHSLQILVRSSVTGSFGLVLRTPGTPFYSLAKLATISTTGVWTLLSFPNIPVWSASGSFPTAPGGVGYVLFVSLAAGSSQATPANDTWQSGNFVGAAGQSNFAANPVNSTFDVAFCQHEPGSLCTTLIDKPFSVSYDECLKYYQKSWTYSTAIGTATGTGALASIAATPANGWIQGFPFLKPMAKAPTMTIYNSNSGAANSVRNNSASTDFAVSSVQASDKNIGAILLTTNPTAGSWMGWHYAADTGF